MALVVLLLLLFVLFGGLGFFVAKWLLLIALLCLLLSAFGYHRHYY